MSRRSQPQQRLSADERKAQIRQNLRVFGQVTPAELATQMQCSDALVLVYAKTMADIEIARRQVQTPMGSRTRSYLRLIEAAA